MVTGPDGRRRLAARGRKGRHENGRHRAVDETAPFVGRCHDQDRGRKIAFWCGGARREKRCCDKGQGLVLRWGGNPVRGTGPG